MLITDGVGTSQAAAVNQYNEIVVTTTSAVHLATLRGDTYAWNAITGNIDTTDNMLTVRNLSPNRLLIINRIYAWADIATAIDVHISTNATAFAAGGIGAMPVVGVNLNTSSAKVADAGGYSDDTGVTQGTIICTLYTNELATDVFGVDYQTNDEIVLGTNGCIGVDCIEEPAAFECTVIGYFVDA